MNRLFLFLYRIRAFLLFALLQLICFIMIIQNNRYQGAIFFNSSNSTVAGILQLSNSISNFVELQTVNQQLASENAILREQLRKATIANEFRPDSIKTDTVKMQYYTYYPAKVVNNSVQWSANYITINKGSISGIKKGMGVVNEYGAVGQVKAVSNNYSVVTSLLHRDLLVSGKIKRTGELCSTLWPGTDYKHTKIQYLPISTDIVEGDTIVTSGYSTVFPENYVIGLVSDIARKEGDSFFEISVQLTNDFKQLSYLYVVDFELKQEIDSLELLNIDHEGI